MVSPENHLSPTSRRFCIDALNLAYWDSRVPSLRVPMTLMAQLLAQGHEARLYFDASARHRFPSELSIYEQLMQHPQHCIEVAAGRTADGLLLRDARATGASLITRDHFADHRRRYRKLIDDPTRRLSGWVEQGQLCVPGLMLEVLLPLTALEAWQALAPLLKPQTARPAQASKTSLPALLAAALLSIGLPRAQASPLVAPTLAPPTMEEVRFYTQPLVRARLRLPDSLRDFAVMQIAPTTDDPARFAVTLQFKAKAPFGGITQHTTDFLMKRSSSGKVWLVTMK